MSVPTFNSQPLFGSITKIDGPGGSYRAQREVLPGVNGARIYRLGGGPVVWTIRGRLIGLSLQQCRQAVLKGISYNNGRLYSFVDNAGLRYTNCLLSAFKPVGPYLGCQYGGVASVTVEVQATVEWMSPTIYLP